VARRTNYAFERNARAKAKAAKREAKREAKLAAKAEKTGEMSEEAGLDPDTPEGQGATEDQDSAPGESLPPENA
jgi:hypothetical protein